MGNLFIKAMPFTFVFFWSTGFVGAKLGLPYIEPFHFLSIRVIFVLILLYLLLAFLKLKVMGNVAEIKHAAISGSLMSGLYLSAAFSAINYGLSAGVTALVVSMQPILTALIVRRLNQTRLAPKQWLGMMVAFCGVIMVLLPKIMAQDIEEGISFLGLSFAILALFGITTGSIYQKSMKSNLDLRVSNFWHNVGAFIVLVPGMLILEEGNIEWTGELVFAMSWLVFVLSILTMMLLLKLISMHSENAVASLFFLVPGVTAVLGWIFFGETLSIFQIFGIIVASIGVALSQPSKK